MDAALVIKSWQLQHIPPGWEILRGYGIRRRGEGVFPSVLLMAEEVLPEETTLERYIANQIEAAKVLLKQPEIKGPTLVAVPGANEARRLGVSYKTDDGRDVVQMQIYATGANVVGNATFTTLETELATVGETMLAMMRDLRFQAAPPEAKAEAQLEKTS